MACLYSIQLWSLQMRFHVPLEKGLKEVEVQEGSSDGCAGAEGRRLRVGGRVDPYIAPEPRRVHYRRVPRLRVVYHQAAPKNERRREVLPGLLGLRLRTQPPVVCGKLGPLRRRTCIVYRRVPPRQEPGLARVQGGRRRHG